MKNLFKLLISYKTIAVLLISSATLLIQASAHATNTFNNLSVDGMNDSIEHCYQQTLKITSKRTQKIPSEKLTVYSCNRILSNSWLPDKTEANARLNRGLIYLYQGKTQAAIKDFKRAVKANPTLQPAHIALAQQAFKQQDYEMALAHYELAIELNTTAASDQDAHNDKHHTQAEKNDLNKLISSLIKAKKSVLKAMGKSSENALQGHSNPLLSSDPKSHQSSVSNNSLNKGSTY